MTLQNRVMTENLTPAEHWENRYREGRAWSGNANAALVREVSGVAPGTALDLGCGEGGDALWLASQGWSVTAVDISPTAVAMGAAAQQPGDDITWIAADLSDWTAPAQYDLVAASFLHSSVLLPREDILRRAAGAVASGGLLLVVGHSGVPPWAEGHHHAADELPGPETVLERLELADGEWEVLTSALIERPDHRVGTAVDSVLKLRRVE